MRPMRNMGRNCPGEGLTYTEIIARRAIGWMNHSQSGPSGFAPGAPIRLATLWRRSPFQIGHLCPPIAFLELVSFRRPTSNR